MCTHTTLQDLVSSSRPSRTQELVDEAGDAGPKRDLSKQSSRVKLWDGAAPAPTGTSSSFGMKESLGVGWPRRRDAAGE